MRETSMAAAGAMAIAIELMTGWKWCVIYFHGNHLVRFV